jgi:hypothetical protein
LKDAFVWLPQAISKGSAIPSFYSAGWLNFWFGFVFNTWVILRQIIFRKTLMWDKQNALRIVLLNAICIVPQVVCLRMP